MEVWPVSIEKLDNGKSLNISFDDKSEFKISAKLLRVEYVLLQMFKVMAILK